MSTRLSAELIHDGRLAWASCDLIRCALSVTEYPCTAVPSIDDGPRGTTVLPCSASIRNVAVGLPPVPNALEFWLDVANEPRSIEIHDFPGTSWSNPGMLSYTDPPMYIAVSGT